LTGLFHRVFISPLVQAPPLLPRTNLTHRDHYAFQCHATDTGLQNLLHLEIELWDQQTYQKHKVGSCGGSGLSSV